MLNRFGWEYFYFGRKRMQSFVLIYFILNVVPSGKLHTWLCLVCTSSMTVYMLITLKQDVILKKVKTRPTPAWFFTSITALKPFDHLVSYQKWRGFHSLLHDITNINVLFYLFKLLDVFILKRKAHTKQIPLYISAEVLSNPVSEFSTVLLPFKE